MNFVMVGVDGSKYAENALDKAIDLAKRYDTELRIVHVYNTSSQYYNFPSHGEFKIPDKDEHIINLFMKSYNEKANKAGLKKVETKIIITPGHAGAGLVAEAEKKCPVITVVGARGMTGITRTLLGSVSDYVTKHSPCDVYVVRS
ncbi:MAG: universal stress protein [Candidatus Methanomethylicus sp.]|nr:universal stress protein [Candidatus Methanomethylicus sp.]